MEPLTEKQAGDTNPVFLEKWKEKHSGTVKTILAKYPGTSTVTGVTKGAPVADGDGPKSLFA